MSPLELTAARVAGRILRTGALGDDHAAERALLAETEAAGIRCPQAIAMVGQLAALHLAAALANVSRLVPGPRAREARHG